MFKQMEVRKGKSPLKWPGNSGFGNYGKKGLMADDQLRKVEMRA